MNDFENAMSTYRFGLLNREPVDRGEWQAKTEGDDPRFAVREILNVQFSFPMPATIEGLQSMVRPNLPWAEDHFRERVAGEPLNPGEQYKNWPWYKQGVEEHKPGGKFSHTYMERMWPKQAGYSLSERLKMPFYAPEPRAGIRFMYGDLMDVAGLLHERPMTRQAFVPIWFPEDTGAKNSQRVPCTLGYHFQVDGKRRLHCTYFARSIDFVRYLRDDAYMAARLAAWMHWNAELDGHDILLGTLTMCIANLHCFEGDVPRLRREFAQEEDEIHGV